MDRSEFDSVAEDTFSKSLTCNGNMPPEAAVSVSGLAPSSGNVLIVTADQQHGESIRITLLEGVYGNYQVEIVPRLATALERLSAGGVDAILVDLDLPDSKGIGTFDRLLVAAPGVPVLVISGTGHEVSEREATVQAAHGSLPTGALGNALIARSLGNMIQRKATEEILFIEKSRAQITLNSISDAVITTDLLGNVDYLNKAAETMTGWTLDDARGLSIREVMPLLNGTTRKPDHNPVEFVLQFNEPMGLTAGTIMVCRDGSEVVIEDAAAPIRSSAGEVRGVVLVFHDISASKAMTRKMAHLAQHDYLTNLPNRLLLNDRISQAIELSSRRRTSLAVLFLDLDNFKPINDTLGHGIGDLLLNSVAQRLSACVRSSDTVSRVGGDEFVVLLQGNSSNQSPRLIAKKILASLAAPYTIEGNTLTITTSIGISTYPADGRDTEALLTKADAAMYRAKKKGRNTYCFFKDCAQSPDLVREKGVSAGIRH